jgi:hypothetical protein
MCKIVWYKLSFMDAPTFKRGNKGGIFTLIQIYHICALCRNFKKVTLVYCYVPLFTSVSYKYHLLIRKWDILRRINIYNYIQRKSG